MVQKGVPWVVAEPHSADTWEDRDVPRPVGTCPLGRGSQGPAYVRTGDPPPEGPRLAPWGQYTHGRLAGVPREVCPGQGVRARCVTLAQCVFAEEVVCEREASLGRRASCGPRGGPRGGWGSWAGNMLGLWVPHHRGPSGAEIREGRGPRYGGCALCPSDTSPCPTTGVLPSSSPPVVCSGRQACRVRACRTVLAPVLSVPRAFSGFSRSQAGSWTVPGSKHTGAVGPGHMNVDREACY